MMVNSEVSEFDSNMTLYTFESRGTSYTVFDSTERDFYEVWSNRKSYSGMPSIRIFNSLDEMGKATKALKHLSLIMAA